MAKDMPQSTLVKSIRERVAAYQVSLQELRKAEEGTMDKKCGCKSSCNCVQKSLVGMVKKEIVSSKTKAAVGGQKGSGAHPGGKPFGKDELKLNPEAQGGQTGSGKHPGQPSISKEEMKINPEAKGGQTGSGKHPGQPSICKEEKKPKKPTEPHWTHCQEYTDGSRSEEGYVEYEDGSRDEVTGADDYGPVEVKKALGEPEGRHGRVAPVAPAGIKAPAAAAKLNPVAVPAVKVAPPHHRIRAILTQGAQKAQIVKQEFMIDLKNASDSKKRIKEIHPVKEAKVPFGEKNPSKEVSASGSGGDIKAVKKAAMAPGMKPPTPPASFKPQAPPKVPTAKPAGVPGAPKAPKAPGAV